MDPDTGEDITDWVNTSALLIVIDSTLVVIQDLRIENSRHAGITVKNYTGSLNVDAITIDSCEIVNTRGHGIHVFTDKEDPGGVSQNITIKNCKLSRVCEGFAEADVPTSGGISNLPQSQGEAIRVAQSKIVNIYGNEIKDHRKEGIDLHEHVENAAVYDNYIGTRAATRYKVTQGTAIYLDPGEPTALPTKNVDIYRNLIDEADSPGITLGSERGGHMENIRIYNNLVNSAGNCFKISDFTNEGVASGNKKHVHVYHNTFVNWFDGNTPPGHQHVCFLMIKETDASKLEGLKFRNNIVARDFDPPEDLFASHASISTFTITHNVYWDPGPGTFPGQLGTNRYPGNPNLTTLNLFIANQQRSVAYGVGSGGAGFNSGVNLGTIPNQYLDFDMDLEPRPAYGADIGALENQ